MCDQPGWRRFTHDYVARFVDAAGLSSRVEKHVGPVANEALSSPDAHRADVPLQPPLHLRIHTINAASRRKIAQRFSRGWYSGTEQPKERQGIVSRIYLIKHTRATPRNILERRKSAKDLPAWILNFLF